MRPVSIWRAPVVIYSAEDVWKKQAMNYERVWIARNKTCIISSVFALNLSKYYLAVKNAKWAWAMSNNNMVIPKPVLISRRRRRNGGVCVIFMPPFFCHRAALAITVAITRCFYGSCALEGAVTDKSSLLLADTETYRIKTFDRGALGVHLK